MENNQNTGAGKGDKPRNCFSKQYRDNYNSIKWGNNKDSQEEPICYDEDPIEIDTDE